MLTALAPSLAQGEAAPSQPQPNRQLSLQAEELDIDLATGALEARQVRVHACGECGPAWTVAARRASLRAGGDVDLLGPVLRVGPVPIFALPWLRVRTGRRWGLLLPQLSISSGSGGGVEVGQGVWIPLSTRAALTTTAAYSSNIAGATVEGELTVDDQLRLTVTGRLGVESSGAAVVGGGHVAAVTFDVDWTSDAALERELTRSVRRQARRAERSSLALIHHGAVQTSVTARVARNLWAPLAGTSVLTRVSLDVPTLRAGPLLLRGGVQSQLGWSPDHGTWISTSASPRVAMARAIGPIRTRVWLSSLLSTWAAAPGSGVDRWEEAAARRALLGGGADLSAPLAKRLSNGALHLLEPGLSYRGVSTSPATGTPPLAATDRAWWSGTGHLLWLWGRTSLRRGAGRVDAEVAQRLVLSPEQQISAPRTRLEVRLHMILAMIDVDGVLLIDDSAGERPEVEGAAIDLDVAAGRVVSGALAWRWRQEGERLIGPDRRHDLPLVPDWELHVSTHTLRGELAVAPHPEVRLRAGAWIDLEDQSMIRAGGGVEYRNRCGCLSASLEIWSRHGRSWPDLFLLVDLGGLSGLAR